MNTEYVAPAPFEIDRAAPMCQNYKHGVQTQVSTMFRPVSATDQEVGSSECRDEKRTESRNVMSECHGHVYSVAVSAAMKSGLKVLVSAAMKSGLKVECYVGIRPRVFCSSECRDEKRTESGPCNAGTVSMRRSSECRDEKRTESKLSCSSCQSSQLL